MSDAAQLAINGGPKAVTFDPGDLFDWPIITTDDEDAVLEVGSVRMDIERDKILTAQQAKEYGLVDQVLESRKAPAPTS